MLHSKFARVMHLIASCVQPHHSSIVQRPVQNLAAGINIPQHLTPILQGSVWRMLFLTLAS